MLDFLKTMLYYMITKLLTTIQQRGGNEIKIVFGDYIRESAIKNLLSAQKAIADKGDVKSLIILTRFILKVSRKFDYEMLNLRLEDDDLK